MEDSISKLAIYTDQSVGIMPKGWVPTSILNLEEHAYRNYLQGLEFVPDWDEYFMRMVYLVSSKSKVFTTKIGAVLVKNKALLGTGYNGLPPRVKDGVPIRLIEPQRRYFEEHAERACIYFCAQQGIITLGSTMYTNGLSCSDCSRAIIRAGVVELVIHKQWEDLPRSSDYWTQNVNCSKEMLSEAGVNVRVFDKLLNITTKFDGKIVNI